MLLSLFICFQSLAHLLIILAQSYLFFLDRSIIHIAQYFFSSVSHSSSSVLSLFRSVIYFCSSALWVLLFSVRSFFVSHSFSPFFIFQLRISHFSSVFVISLHFLILLVFSFMFITLFSASPSSVHLFLF
jgi:hypothetical protein